MRSIRAKYTSFTVGAIIVALSIATFISVFSINDLGRSDADNMLHLMCKSGAMNLESYFDSVEDSVTTVSSLVQDSFEGMPYDQLESQVERARSLFKEVAFNTNGVLTYYFRIDPKISDTVKGFWYVNLDGRGFQEHEVTDISQYDTDDTSQLVWFTVPKATGEGVWLPPYVTDNLDVKVISYNVPVYWEGNFIGVIGIEIDYETLAREVESIKLYENGYAFILDENSNVIYHPQQASMPADGENVAVNSPDKVISDNHIQYHYDGIEKEAVWAPLSNGMRLYVTVPLSEINKEWETLIGRILVASFAILVLATLVMLRLTSHLTKPLTDLTRAARNIEQGKYDFDLDYDEDDEVGILTRTFKALADHTKEHISELNKQVYIDALTGIKNKGAYADVIQRLQDQVDASDKKVEFGIGVFDCDHLKFINDTYGHEKGDEYLKRASQLICEVFKHSPVFRIGGDEFAVVLENADYRNREELMDLFRQTREELCEATDVRWEQVSVTMGLAVYDPEIDTYVIDVARRADQQMYGNKRQRKTERRVQ